MSDDLMTFVGEGAGPVPQPVSSEPRLCWRVLITDDEQDVHTATTFALRNTKILGRDLEFLHARSADEAYRLLCDNDDIAVIILDVVMETPNAGLDLVAVIRHQLNNHHSRIILRTGQPNQAPEIEVIRDYDINDYKLKSELTQNKLYAALTTAVRSYQQIRVIEAGKRGLGLIVQASSDLMAKHGLHEFAQGVITQLSGLLSIPPEGLICVRKARNLAAETVHIIAAAGHYCALIDHPLSDLSDEDERRMLAESLSLQRNIYGSKGVALYLGSSERGDMSCYVGSTEPMHEVDRKLLELFCSNISACADNVDLVERLRALAFCDIQLGLPNKNALAERLDALSQEVMNSDYHLAFIHIDDYTEIATALGLNYGDEYIAGVARRISASFPDSAEVFRCEARSFAVLADAETLAPERMSDCFSEPLSVGPDAHYVSATVGISPLADLGHSAPEMLKNMELLLALAIKSCPGEVLLCNPATLDQMNRSLIVLHDLRSAFDNERLMLFFVPRFQLDSGRCLALKAQLCWRGQCDKVHSANAYADMIACSGLAMSLGEWALRSAITSLREIHSKGWPGCRVSLSVAPAQLRHPDFIILLKRVLADTGADARDLDLAVQSLPELVDDEDIYDRLCAIRALGFSISVEGAAGAALSSLPVLQKLPIDQLTLDRSFVRSLDAQSGQEIAEFVLSLASRLNLQVLAEGIDTQADHDFVRRINCAEAEGRFFAEPMLLSALLDWMAQNPDKYDNAPTASADS